MARQNAGASRQAFEGFSRDDIMAQLASEAETMRPRADEFSLADFAAKAGMPERSALRFLDSKAKAGALMKRRGLLNGRWCWLYSGANKN